MSSKASFAVLSIIALCLACVQAQPLLHKGRRCKCINTINRLHPSMRINNVKILVQQDYCPNVEIIVNLQNGNKICLNPTSVIGKKIINLMELKKNE
ncbi:interleukin-8 [Callorhinchus milii]|uniref:Growth-regulated alpha protein-like n=1 Tax=Callorhinchus milii TaxID=7868 RepID=V9L6I8_CALMI|nr:interleukin-8 [Callorhinchus milii]|eukprot:gi/632966721/ref/XP_007899573.1/ PREDICTED: growth-regulated alpha protein-like [Callorhinchus milii]